MDMCNCLKKFKTQFSLLKKLTGVLIFFFVSASLWATDYYWIGGDSTSATWADGDKWSLAEGGTSAAAYPGNTDTAIIKNTVTFTDTDVSCDAIVSSKALSFDGNLTLTSASTIAGGLNIDGNLTLSGELTLNSGDLSVTGDTTNNAGTILISSGDCILANYISYAPSESSYTIECSGELQASGGQFRGDISAGSITISGDASLLGATHTISSTGTQHYGGEILVNSSSGSLELRGSTITFDANVRSWNGTYGSEQKALIITGNAVFNANAGATNPLKSLSVSGTTIISGSSIATNEGQTYSGEVEISSSTSLTSTSNASITFNDVLTIDNGKTLSLNGSPAISSLVMDGSSLALSNSAALTISNLILTSTGVGASNNTLTAGNGSITVSNATYYSNNLTTSGNVSLAAGNIGTLTADGITTLAGGSISSLAVTGSNLNLTGDLEVTTLSLSGTSTTNLELSGSGKSIILASNQTSGSYLTIPSDLYIKASATAIANGVTGRYYQATNSIPSAGTTNSDYATAIKNGWRIRSLALLDYTWAGSTSTDWADGSNWALGITPGSGDTAGVDVTIPAGASNYPIISDDDYTLKDLIIGSAAELSVNGKKLQAENLDCGGSINLSSAELEITNSITTFEELNLNDSTFTNSTGNDLTITTLTLGSSESTLNPGTSSITVANNISGGRLKTYGNVSTAALSLSSLNVSSGTLTASGNVDISGASSALVVDGTLDMDSASYSLTLTGSSASDLLSVSGSGSISLSSSQILGDFIKLEGSLSIDNSKIYTAIHSQNTQSTANPYNGWNILSGDLIFMWDGNTSTSVLDAENWLTDLVPGTNNDILIPALAGASPNYPILTAATQYNKITVDTDAQLDLDSFDLTASEITNKGLVKLAGSQTVTATSITNDSDSTVEYYGTLSGGNLPMKGTSTSFGKLLFSDGANGTISDVISVAATTDILCGSGKTLSLSGANTFTGLVKIGDSDTSENGGEITINSAAGFTLDSNALAESLTIQSAVNLSGNVTTSGGQTYHGGVTTGSQDITLLSGTDTVSFLSTLTGSGNALSVGNTTTASNVIFSDVVSNLATLSVAGTTQIDTSSITTTGGQTYTGDVSVTSNTSLTSSTQDDINFINKLTVSNEKTLSLNGNTSINNAILNGSILNNNSTGSAISITTLTLGNNESTLNAETSSISVSSAISGGKLKIYGNVSTAALSLSSLNVSSGVLTVSGNVDISGVSSSLVVDGTLDMDSGSYELTLTGSSASDLLTVSGSGTIKLASSQILGNFIKLEGNLSIDNSKIYTAIHSQNNQSDANPYNGWNILSGDLIFMWDGNTSTSVLDAENWVTDLVPGTTNDILIPSLSGASPNYPILTAAAVYNKVTVDTDAKLDLASFDLTASEIINKGLVRLAGSQSVSATLITNDSDSTVEYYGTLSGGNLPMKGTSTSFGKLLFSDGANGTVSDAISVAGTTDILCGSGKTLSLTGANTFTSLVKIGDSTTSENGGQITINSAAGFTLDSNALADSLDVSSSVVLSGDVKTVGGGQTYTGAVTTGSQNINLLAGTDTVTFLSTFTGSANSLTIGNSTTKTNAIFTDVVSNLDTLYVAGTTQINAASITTTGGQSYSGAVSTGSQALSLLAGTNTVTFSSTFTGSGNTLSVGNTTTASNVIFSDAVSNLATLSVAGTTQINAASITTTGGQTYTGAVSTGSQNLTLLSGTDTVSFLSTLTGSGNTLSIGNTTTASNAIFTGTVSSLATLSVAGTTQINTTSITTTGGQTYTGAVSTGTQDLTLLAGTDTITFLSTLTGSANNLTIGNSTTPSNVTFSAPVSSLTSLLVTGATQIDTNSITTTGGQTYTGNVTTTSTNTTLLATDDDSIINFKAALLAATNNLTINCGTHLTSGTSATITAGDIQIIGNYENTGSITSNAASTSVTKNIVNTGSADFTNGISLAGNFTDTIGDWTGSITLNGTDAQNFNPNTTTTYSNVFINKTNGITNFTDTVTITTLTDSTTYTADINFYKNINILTDTSLNTSGKIIFASQADSITSFTSTFGSSSNYKDFTHTAGQTILNGNIIADEITLAESNLKGITNINCTNLTLQNDLTCTLETYYLKLTGNLTTSGTHNFYPNVMIDGSFIGGGSSIFKKNLYFFKDSSTASTASINSLTVDGDLIISAERAFNTSGTIRTKKNFVLYRGQISAAASSVIQADLDIILLGQFYSLNDASRSSNPSNTDYIYQQTRTNGSCNYTRTDFSAHNDQMPDGTYLPDSTDGFTGLYTGASGSVLHAGKNWYANGLKDSDTNPTLGLTASSQWYIDIPDLTDTQNQTGFAETYNSYADHNTVRCHTPPAGTTAPDANGIYSRMPAYNCSYQADSNGDALTNVNWLFTDLLITQAYTERDNSIYIEFNRAVRNSNNELKNAISRFTNSSVTYQGFYTDPDCTSALPDNTNRSEDSANKVWLYLKTADSTSWNTDATGTSAGNSASTNRYGIHQNVIPYIKVSENNSYPITDIWGKRLAYYDGTSPFENVTDHTGPVLYSVRTGQEFHSPYNSSTGESSQPSYDSHNFLEFRYSEAVNFGSTTAGTSTPLQNIFDNSDITSAIWLPAAASTSADNTVNIRVRDSFGALTNSITQSGNLTLAGLATIENGKLHTASQGVDNKYVNALYRQDAFSIRLSLAGYTEGTATDQHSNIYKKWTGYIESAIQPSGLVSLVADTNNLITDCALDSDGVTPLYNPQIRYADDATVTPSVNIIYSNGNQYDSSGIYGNWDLSEPVFATLRLDSTSDWAESQYFEAVGTNSGSGSTLDKIEFHIFDNTPAYSSSDPAIWLSEKGWVTNTAGSSTLYDASYSYCADITGGSKQFDSDSSQRSSGGIRYSTLETSSAGFKYSSGQGSSVVPSTNFVSGINGIYTGAKASLFVGSSTTRRSPTDPDGLYFGLGLSDTTFPVTQSFTVSYDEDSAYITDLAGNRLRSKTIRTIDRTPPSFDITLSPVNQKELNVVFVKKLVTDKNDIKYRDNTNGNQIEISEEYESLIPKCFDLISISSGSASTSSSINIDYTVPAKIQNITSQTNDSEFTVITLTLTQNISLSDLQNLYIRLKYADGYQELTQDPVTGINNSRVTFIQDELGNYMQMYSAHAISDFAINVVNPLYAYDSEMTYDSQSLMDGLYNEGSWAVHDWNADQQNYGTLPANHEYELIADIDDGTEDKTYLPSGVRAFFAINQTSSSVSSQYNSDLNTSLRVWLPALSNSVIAALSPVNNDLSNILTKDSVTLDSETPERINFTIGKDFSTTWGSGKQVSFLFGLLDTNNEIIRIYNAPYYDVTNNTYNLALSTAVPLFVLRTKDTSVLSSLDLWSFKTHASVEQRGGVTILNNVIDLSNGEKTVLKVNNPSNGKVNIMVMTLDGNIITYLNRGNLTSGQHYFYWDGKNKKNNQVARGMYFIRIVGNGFDETRKVLVTK